MRAIRDQERRHQAIGAELADLKRPRVVPMTAPQLRAVLCEKANEMARAATEARADRTSDVAEIGRRPDRVHAGSAGATLHVPRNRTLATFFSGIVCPQAMASPTGGLPEWTREIPGVVPAVGAGQAA